MAAQEINTAALIERAMRITALAESAKLMIDREAGVGSKENASAFTLMNIILGEAEFITKHLDEAV